MVVAHLRVNPDGTQSLHSLEDHLSSTASRAKTCAAPFSSQAWAELAGLWHDLGKYRPGFQRYIRQANDPDAHVEGRIAGPEKTHSAAGALHALDILKCKCGRAGGIAAHVLAYIIAGFHPGLDDWHKGLKARLDGENAKHAEAEAVSSSTRSSLSTSAKHAHAEAVAAASVEFRAREASQRQFRNITNVRA
ncbi:MAG TPA: CRISPR-associated endonuclease Cas3'' [Burkholderiales bacterium]|nr:CRISPR-associated endonuclease Cas3'' [Burkholderiales bacterium]